MSKNLRNLQRLGQDLGREVDEQNQLLDRIQTKADRNDTIVRVQDKQVIPNVFSFDGGRGVTV